MKLKSVLILNRRCVKHPQRGGAEVYIFELAKTLIKQGYNVEWFSSGAYGLEQNEEIEGIKFIRRGSELTTHFFGFLNALKNKNGLVIDTFNGIGFFTFFKKNAIVLVFQLYKEFWNAELGIWGYPLIFVEKILLRLYRNRPAIIISNSTNEDLRELGFRDVTVINIGVDIQPLESPAVKEDALTLIYLGRLKSTKNPEDAIRAFLVVRKVINDAKLRIIGDGPLYEPLRKKYENVKEIIFHGFIDNRKKYDFLQRAHFLLIPSIREGWGMVVTEANAMGTPAIGYNVHGIKDSIRDGDTGVLVKDHKEMASTILELWKTPDKYNAMCTRSLAWAGNFSWDRSRKAFLKFISERIPDLTY